MRHVLAFPLFAAIIACGGGHTPATGGDAGPDHGDGGSAADSPVILSLTSTVSSITVGQSFTVVAVVTEPTGLANLVGGNLTSDDGAITYGAFVASQQGTYSLTISWDGLNTGLPINFVGQSDTKFRATFFNLAGNRTSQTLPMKLSCGSGSDLDGACAGACVKLDSVDDCGACNARCPAPVAGQFATLSADSCSAPNTCAFQGGLLELGTIPEDSCSTACAAAAPGATCTTAHATMSDNSAQDIGCDVSAATFPPTGTTAVSGHAFCKCQNEGLTLKTSLGSCSSFCGVATCEATTFSDGGGNSIVADACSEPYLYAAWDDIESSHNVAMLVTVDLNVRPTKISCSCQGPTQ